MSAFLISASVSVANGSNTVTVTGSINCGQVVAGTAVFIDGLLAEGASGTAPDGSGVSTLTLALPWPYPTKSAVKMIAFNTFEGMVGAIARAREAALNSAEVLTAFDEVLTATTPTVTVNINGVPIVVTPYGYLSAQSAALIAELEGATTGLADLQTAVDQLTEDVAEQQGIVDANLATSTAAATTATTQAGLATDAADAAVPAAAAAVAAADDAVPAAATATAAADLAEDWASKPENSLVDATKYSALHYAAKAEYWAGQAAGAAAGAMVYSGTYNASSNTFPPAPTSGQVYEINTPGTLGSFENTGGSVNVQVGDHIIKTASGWVYWFGHNGALLPVARVNGLQAQLDTLTASAARSKLFALIGMIR